LGKNSHKTMENEEGDGDPSQYRAIIRGEGGLLDSLVGNSSELDDGDVGNDGMTLEPEEENRSTFVPKPPPLLSPLNNNNHHGTYVESRTSMHSHQSHQSHSFKDKDGEFNSKNTNTSNSTTNSATATATDPKYPILSILPLPDAEEDTQEGNSPFVFGYYGLEPTFIK
jgi:hypothetical protein